MIIQIKIFLSLIALANLISNSNLAYKIKGYFYLATDSDFHSNFQYFFIELLNCSACVGFYIGLSYYQDFYNACLLSLFCQITDLILRRL